MNNYFISYIATDKRGQQIWGRCALQQSVPMTEIALITQAEKLFREQEGFKQFCILNWRPFESDQPDTNDYALAHFALPGGATLKLMKAGACLMAQRMSVTEAQEVADALGKELVHS